MQTALSPTQLSKTEVLFLAAASKNMRILLPRLPVRAYGTSSRETGCQDLSSFSAQCHRSFIPKSNCGICGSLPLPSAIHGVEALPQVQKSEHLILNCHRLSLLVGQRTPSGEASQEKQGLPSLPSTLLVVYGVTGEEWALTSPQLQSNGTDVLLRRKCRS